MEKGRYGEEGGASASTSIEARSLSDTISIRSSSESTEELSVGVGAATLETVLVKR